MAVLKARRSLLAATLLAGLAGSGFAQSQTPAPSPAAPPATEAPKDAAKETAREPAKEAAKDIIAVADLIKPGPITDYALGDDKASIVVVEYASLTCPHCATFHTKTFDFLKKVYIDTGKVRFIFRDFPFDGVALAATMLARCGGASETDATKARDKYFAMVNTLFYRQATWAFGSDPEAELIKIAKEYGFTQESFDACLQNQTMYEGVLEVRKRAFETFKVDSTPTIFVNGEPFRGALTPEQMDSVLKRALVEKK